MRAYLKKFKSRKNQKILVIRVKEKKLPQAHFLLTPEMMTKIGHKIF
jgi:hypothetical protein